MGNEYKVLLSSIANHKGRKSKMTDGVLMTRVNGSRRTGAQKKNGEESYIQEESASDNMMLGAKNNYGFVA